MCATGEEALSYGYGGTAKASENCKFKDYGETFTSGDVITAYLVSAGVYSLVQELDSLVFKLSRGILAYHNTVGIFHLHYSIQLSPLLPSIKCKSVEICEVWLAIQHNVPWIESSLSTVSVDYSTVVSTCDINYWYCHACRIWTVSQPPLPTPRTASTRMSVLR